MSVAAIGFLYAGDAERDARGHPHRLRARLRGAGLHVRVHAGLVARYGGAERLRGDGLDHPAVDPALHPEGRGDRAVQGRPGPLLGHACLDAPHPGRARHRQRLRLRAVRRHGGLEPGHLLGHRLGRHPGDAQARLLAGLRRRHHRGGGHAGHPAAALHHHDPLRGGGRAVARAGSSSPASGRACCWSACSRPGRSTASARNTPPPRWPTSAAARPRRSWRRTPTACASASRRCRGCCPS